jgi:hypothetical protein
MGEQKVRGSDENSSGIRLKSMPKIMAHNLKIASTFEF